VIMRAAPSQREQGGQAALNIAERMEGADGVSMSSAPSQPKAAPPTVERMEGANGVCMRVAPVSTRQHLPLRHAWGG